MTTVPVNWGRGVLNGRVPFMIGEYHVAPRRSMFDGIQFDDSWSVDSSCDWEDLSTSVVERGNNMRVFVFESFHVSRQPKQ